MGAQSLAVLFRDSNGVSLHGAIRCRRPRIHHSFHAALSHCLRQKMRISSLLCCFRKVARPPAIQEPVHQAGKQVSGPAIGILREPGTLYPYDAEALAGRRLHDHPTLEAVYYLCAQLL
jgi:hypothetical protein